MNPPERSPYRQAVAYCVVVAVAAIAVLLIGRAVAGSDIPTGVFIAFPAVVFAGAVGAQVQAYRQWRREANWQVWQGAGWFLFSLFVIFLASVYGQFSNH